MDTFVKHGKQQRVGAIGLLPILVLMALMMLYGRSQATTIGEATPGSVPPPITNHSLYLPIVLHNVNLHPDPTVFGMQIYSIIPPTHLYYPYLIESQADWVRTILYWNWVEPVNLTPDGYNWTNPDNYLSLALADMGNRNLIVTVRNVPEWAAEHPNGVLYPAALPEFAEFMGALVERYDGDGLDDAPGSPVINYWEMYNEPDNGSSLWEPSWGDYGAEYAQMLQAIYPAVKNANPQAQLVFGGLALDWFEDQGGTFVEHFLDDVLAAGGGDYFDVMNFHIYPSLAPNWTTQGVGLKEKAEFVRQTLATYGLSKAMIVTEAGWYGDDQPVGWPTGPEVQASYVVQFFTQSLAADVDVTIWFMLHDVAADFTFGLITNSNPPMTRPSYTVYQTAVAELSMAQFQRQLPPAETGTEWMEAYQFSRNGRPYYVAWLNPVDSSETVPLSLPGTQAHVRTMSGVQTTLMDGDDGTVDGRITAPITAAPRYIEIQP